MLSRAAKKDLYDLLGIALATGAAGGAHAGIAYLSDELRPAEVEQFTLVVAVALLTFKAADSAELALTKLRCCAPYIQANLFAKMTRVVINTTMKGLIVLGTVEGTKHYMDPRPTPAPLLEDVTALSSILGPAVFLKEMAIAFAKEERRIPIATLTETLAVSGVGYAVLHLAGLPAFGAFALAIITRGAIGTVAQKQLAKAQEEGQGLCQWAVSCLRPLWTRNPEAAHLLEKVSEHPVVSTLRDPAQD